MPHFEDFIADKFKAIYLSPQALVKPYSDTLSNFVDGYSNYLSFEELDKLRKELRQDTTTVSSFINQFNGMVRNYHQKIKPEDFDYSLPFTPETELDDHKRSFLYYYADLLDNISGVTKSQTGERIVFDFSSLDKLHISKKNIRKVLTELLGRDIKSWELDKIKTIDDLKKLYETTIEDKITTSISPASNSSNNVTTLTKQTSKSVNIGSTQNNFSKELKKDEPVTSEKTNQLKTKEGHLVNSSGISEEDLQYFANNLRPDIEFFKEEEDRVKKEYNEAKSKENETEDQIRSLGSKPWAGKEPEAKSYLIEPIKTCGSIWLVCLIILFVFHCAFWLIKVIFDIPWDTWGWTKTCFWWGLIVIGIVFGGALIAYIIKYAIWNNIHKKALEWDKWNKFYKTQKNNYKQKQSQCSKTLNRIQQKRINILEYAIRKKLNLPIKEITDNLYNTLKNKYFQLYSLQNKIDSIKDADEKLQTSISYADQKLDVFFQWSIPSEAQNNNVLNDFLNSYNKKTKNYREDTVIPYLKDSSINAIIKENNGYGQNLLDADIDEFTEILEWDTSGIFTKHSSSRLEEQVNALEQSYRNAVTTYESYLKVGKKINQILGLSRLVAYKNIYLGVELLNIIRENSGGGTLSTIDDKIDAISFKKNSSMEIKEFSSSQAFKDILSTGFESMLTTIGNGLQDKSTRKFMSQNPKSAAMAVAGMAVFEAGQALVDAWKQRNAKIESLLKKQKHIINEMERIPGVYLENLAASARALEIADSIIKTNKGFMSIYQPIAQKIFNQKDISSISMIECQKLVLAIKEYKNISSSKL